MNLGETIWNDTSSINRVYLDGPFRGDVMTSDGFEVVETGKGPVVLMVPGSYATPAAWKGIQNALGGSFRLISTSLPGYGSSPEVRPQNDADISHLVDFITKVVETIDAPFHVVGHSWGGHVLLAALLARRINPQSAVLFEANPLFANPVGAQFPWREEVRAMVRQFESALDANQPEAAAIIIDFYSQPGAFQTMPESVQAYCRSTATTNLRDWHSAATFTPVFSDFAAVALPTTLVCGSKTVRPVADVNAHLLANLPAAQREVVNGAGHFLITTHPEACAKIIRSHFHRHGVLAR